MNEFEISEQFYQAKEKILKNFNHLQELIHNDFPPDERSLSEIVKNSTLLREQYNAIQKQAEALFVEEAPLAPMSFGEYETKIASSQLTRLRQEIQELTAIYQQFKRVTTKVASLAEALEPFKQVSHLEELRIPPLEKPTEIHADLTESSVKYQNFLTCLHHEDLDSDEGDQLLENVENVFGKKIARGLYGNKFTTVSDEDFLPFIPPDNSSTSTPKGHIEEKKTEIFTTETKKQALIKTETSARLDNIKKPNKSKEMIDEDSPFSLKNFPPPPKKLKLFEENDKNTSISTFDTTDIFIPSEKGSEEITATKEENAEEILDTTPERTPPFAKETPRLYGKIPEKGDSPLLTITSKTKKKKANPNSFLSDTDTETARFIIPMMATCGLMSEKQIFDLLCLHHSDFDDNCTKTLERDLYNLVNRGILYTSAAQMDLPVLYGLSDYTYDCFKKKPVMELHKNSQFKKWYFTPNPNRCFFQIPFTVSDATTAFEGLNLYLEFYVETCHYDCSIFTSLPLEKTLLLTPFGLAVMSFSGKNGKHSQGYCLTKTLTEPAYPTMLFGDSFETPDDFDPEFSVLLYRDNCLYLWEEGEWTLQTGSPQEMDEDFLEDQDESEDFEDFSEESTLESDFEAEKEQEEDSDSIEEQEELLQTSFLDDFSEEEEKNLEESLPEANPFDDLDEEQAQQEEILPDSEEMPQLLQDDPIWDGSAKEVAQYLLENRTQLTDQDLVSLIEKLLEAQDCVPLEENKIEQYHNLINAVLLAKVGSFNEKCTLTAQTYQGLSLATGISLGDNFNLVPDTEWNCEAEQLAAYCFELMAPSKIYDFQTREMARSYLNCFEDIFPNYPMVKPLFNTLCQAIQEEALQGEGFCENLLVQLNDVSSQKRHLEKIYARAGTLMSEPNIKTQINGIRQFKSLAFGKDSELYNCMNNIFSKEDNITELEEILSLYTDESNGRYQINKAKIETEIDRLWNEATKGMHVNKITLNYLARNQSYNAFLERVELIKLRVDFKSSGSSAGGSLEGAKSMRLKLQKQIHATLTDLKQVPSQHKPGILYWMLEKMLRHLDTKFSFSHPFANLLQTGWIPLDEKGMPYLCKDYQDLTFYEPWRCVLQHIATQDTSFETAKKGVHEDNYDNFDNLYQHNQITAYLNHNEGEEISPGDIKRCIYASNQLTTMARDSVILAFTYARIEENEKDHILQLIENNHEEFCRLHAFGCWRHFLKAIEKGIDLMTEKNKKPLLETIEYEKSRSSGESIAFLTEAQSLIESSKNLAVAEEYINRFKAGERELPKISDTVLNPKHFCHFISKEVFNPLYERCRNIKGWTMSAYAGEFESSLKKSVANSGTDDWTARDYKNSIALLNAWPTQTSKNHASNLYEIFTNIGFNVRKVEKNSNILERKDCFKIDIIPEPRNNAGYAHPIAALGTLINSPMDVVVLFGNRNASQLLSEITKAHLGKIIFVLLDYHMSLAERRSLVEQYRKETSNLHSFFLLDRILLLHLAMHRDVERLPIFLQCTLPFTYYQPFLADQGATCDEMFFGRKEELKNIIDGNGPVILYGGRQLGKTALLERAYSLCSRPDEKKFAVKCSLSKLKTEEDVMKAIMMECQKSELNFKGCKTLKEFCFQIDKGFKNGKYSTFYLFLDECDSFLEQISLQEYEPILALIDLRRDTKNKFKFVLAGLHNVSRARRAIANNGVFGQLGSAMCIKPLKPQEALSLISRPLQFLGFSIDKIEHLETILTNTNYYPGLLQLFGYTLVSGLSREYSKHYSPDNENPPFTLSDSQLGSIMNSEDLSNTIKEKLQLSLKLDPRYDMLARCIAILYYCEDENTFRTNGIHVNDIRSMSQDFKIRCLEETDDETFENLLSEMEDMGILAQANPHEYRLRRKAFLEIIGPTLESIEQDIVRENEVDYD